MIIMGGKFVAKRACDVCGDLRSATPGMFRMVDKRWVCNSHPHYMTYETADKEPYKTFGAKPLPNARPFQTIASYSMQEGLLLSILESAWNYASVNEGPDIGGVTNEAVPRPRSGVSLVTDSSDIASPASAAAAAIYTASMVIEAKATLKQVAVARAILLKCANWLLTVQLRGPASLGTSADAAWGAYGGAFNLASLRFSVTPAITAQCGRALLMAYQVFGTASYLTAATACASQLLLLCRGDVWTGSLTSPSALRTNTPCFGYYYFSPANTYGANPSNNFITPANFGDALQFFVLYKTVAGDATIVNSATTNYTGSINATPTAIMTAMHAFWTTNSPGTAPKIGLSSATPRSYYDLTASAWAFADAAEATGTQVLAHWWATAIAGLYAYEGASSRVIELFDFLMASTSNASFQLPAEVAGRGNAAAPYLKWSGSLGDYSPSTTGIINTIQVRETVTLVPVNRNANAVVYPWKVGELAALYASRQADGLETLKAAMSQPVPRANAGTKSLDGSSWAQLGVQTGLSGQMIARAITPQYLATFGLIYRQGVNSYSYRGHA